mgnify:CR=1 FL=1
MKRLLLVALFLAACTEFEPPKEIRAQCLRLMGKNWLQIEETFLPIDNIRLVEKRSIGRARIILYVGGWYNVQLTPTEVVALIDSCVLP